MRQEPMDYEHLLQTASAERAPARLRSRIDAERDRTLVRRMVVRRMKLTGALAAAAAVLGIVVGLASTAGGGPPGALAAAELAARGAQAAAPPVSATDPRFLRARLEGVPFPAWDARGWRASGLRADALGDRDALTVFYRRAGGAQIGYTIVGGEPLPWPDGARRVVRRGVEVWTARRDGRVTAVWRVGGHTCVLSAPEAVGAATLVALAAAPSYVATR